MVPMHRGLINGPVVSHNLISAEGSPVPCLRYQMAPRLKLLMSSGPKKKEPRYAFSFSLKKSPQMNPLQVLQQGPLLRDLPVYMAFLHNYQIPHKNSPKYRNVSLLSKALGKERPSMFPKSGAPWKRPFQSLT